MQNFEADLFMMVSRPSEANLGGRRAKYCRGLFFVQKINFYLSTRSDPDFRGSRELNRSPGRPGEGQGGPNRGQLDPKIGQNLRTKK